MKEDKTRPPTNRQRKQALRFGISLDVNDTIRSACQKLNAAAQAEAISRGKGNQGKKTLPQ